MFKLPSIAKTPKYKVFSYQPRHYDPVKDEFEERVRRAEEQARADRNSPEYSSERAIRGAMRKHSRLQRKGADFSQLFFVIGFGGIAALYMAYGNVALLALVAFLYLYIRYKRSQSA